MQVRVLRDQARHSSASSTRFPRAEATGLSLKTNRATDGRREPATPGAHLARNFLSRVQLGGRALPRRGREGWFDSIHAHCSNAAVPRMGRSATNADGEGSSPSGGTTQDVRVAVWDQPGLQNRAGGVRSLGSLPATCLGSSTVERQAGFSFLARFRAGERSLPTLTGKVRVQVPSEAPTFTCPLGSAAERRPHTPEVTVRLGQGVPTMRFHAAVVQTRQTHGFEKPAGASP